MSPIFTRVINQPRRPQKTLWVFLDRKGRCLMNRIEIDESREHRIDMEITVDAYGAEEQAMGWYYYLDDLLQFLFRASCMTARRISPLK